MEQAKSKEKCHVCRKEVFKYQCPRCSRRTCSLECCQAHKEHDGCNGKRDRTTFLPVSRMDDNTIVSDYHFLEDIVGNLESSTRLLREVGESEPKRPRRSDHRAEPSYPTVNIHPKWRKFQEEASKKGVKVQFMPAGMQRHKSNHSHLKKDTIEWTVEWRLHSKDESVSPISHLSTCSEDLMLSEALSKVASIDGSLSNFHFLIKDIPCPSNKPVYSDLSAKSSIQDILKDRTVIEYPTIEIVPSSRLDEFPKRINVV